MTKEEIKEALSESIGETIKSVLPDMVKDAVADQIKGLGVNRKNILDPNEGDPKPEGEQPAGEGEEKPAEELEGKAKIQKFINAVTAKDRQLISRIMRGKAVVEGTPSAGGYLVPDEFQAELVRLAEDFGLVRRFARRIPMGSDTRNIPRLTTSVTVYWPGENTAGTPSDPVFGQIQLLAKTCVGLTVVSNEMLEDSNPEISSILLELFAEALSGEEDKQGLAGTGAPFTGILEDTNVADVTMATGDTSFANVTADYLRDLISELKPLALAGAGYIMHRTVWGTVQKLKDNGALIATTANPVVMGTGANTGVVGYIWGYPVYLSEKMPYTDAVDTPFIIFGNLRFLFLGDRRTVTMAVSDSATVGTDNVFEQNSSAVRVTERIALAVAIPTAFAVLKTAAS